jgi:hypothetical protein
MADEPQSFAQSLDARRRGINHRGSEPPNRGTSANTVGTSARDRAARAQQIREFASKLKAHEDPREKKFDLLEKALRTKEQELAGSAAGTAADTLVSSHHSTAHRAKHGDWKSGDWGVGYGTTWADSEAQKQALTALNLKHVPKKGERMYAAYAKEFWMARGKIADDLSRAHLEEMSCLTMMQKQLESYARASEILSQDQGKHEKQLTEMIKKARDARPHPEDALDARGTVVLEELRKEFGFETIHVDAVPADPKKYWNNQQINPKTGRPIINYSSDADARRHARIPRDENNRRVDGADTQQKIDVSVGIDHFAKLGERTTAESRKWWKVLKESEFAVGVADQGFHTFAVSRGFVYEVHWDRGPDNPTLTGKRSLEDFFNPNRENGFGWGSGIIAVPPEALPQKILNR